jgi:CheY-like chemotaxis protein
LCDNDINRQPDIVVVAEAANGWQAVERFREYLPDVTLLDMRMPPMSGVEAALGIRAEFPDALPRPAHNDPLWLRTFSKAPQGRIVHYRLAA